MVTTRSMSGTTKTVKPPPKVVARKSGTAKAVKPPPKVVARKSGTAKAVKPPPIVERNPARMDALSLFMIKEYMPQYFETHPPITSVSQHNEILRAGHVKWFYMSESEKAPWIELNEEMNAEGYFLERVMHVPPQFWESRSSSTSTPQVSTLNDSTSVLRSQTSSAQAQQAVNSYVSKLQGFKIMLIWLLSSLCDLLCNGFTCMVFINSLWLLLETREESQESQAI